MKQTYTGTLYQWGLVAYPFTIEADSPEEAADRVVNHGDGEYGLADVDWETLGDVEDVKVETDEHVILYGFNSRPTFNPNRGELIEIDREEL